MLRAKIFAEIALEIQNEINFEGQDSRFNSQGIIMTILS